MAEKVIFEDAEKRIIESSSASPDKPGGWRSTRTEWKAGSTEANADALRSRLTAFLALPTPTPAQNAKAVKALVRLALRQLDDVTDTA